MGFGAVGALVGTLVVVARTSSSFCAPASRHYCGLVAGSFDVICGFASRFGLVNAGV